MMNTRAERRKGPGLKGAGRALAWMLLATTLPAGAQASPAGAAEEATPASSGTDSAGMAQQLSALKAQLAQQQRLLETLQGTQAAGSAEVPGEPAQPPAAGAGTLPLATAAVAPQGPPPSPAVPPVPTGSPSPAPVAGGDTTPAASPATPVSPAEQALPAPDAAASSPAPVTSPQAPLPDDENTRRAYASGVSLAYEVQQSLAVQKSLGISLPPAVLMAGLEDALSHRPLRMQDGDIQARMASLNADFTTRMQTRRADEANRGREFRASFRKQKGVISDAGALYLITDRGSARRLRTTDTVTLQLTGRLPDGTVFDGSGNNGQTRQVKVGAMLPAIAIGLQKVGDGGHLTVVVPPEKGYGEMGLPPAVPGGATLIFDITVKGRDGEG